jgi:guanylate kinase
VLHDEMLECSTFRDWFYGTSYESVRSDCVNIGVFNPTGVESLIDRPDVDVQVFRVRASDKTRMLRQLNREENPDVHEIVRRFHADWLDFAELDAPYIEVKNETFEDLHSGVKQILSQLGPWLSQGQN